MEIEIQMFACFLSFVGHMLLSCHQACVWAESGSCTATHLFHQVFGRRSLNNAHMHHFASSFPHLSLWTKKQEQTAAPASITKDELLLPLSLSLWRRYFPFHVCFYARLPGPTCVPRNQQKYQKLNIKMPRSPLNTCHLSFVQIMARVAIETGLLKNIFSCFQHFFLFFFIKFSGQA